MMPALRPRLLAVKAVAVNSGNMYLRLPVVSGTLLIKEAEGLV